jgi:anti-sigma factor RsiW
MTFEEARELVALYGAGQLTPEQKAGFDALLAQSPELQKELRQIKEEDELLALALGPLRPSQSTRLRLSAAMLEAFNKAAREESVLAAKTWRITKVLVLLLLLGLLCIFITALVGLKKYRDKHPRPKPPIEAPQEPTGQPPQE